MRAILKGRLQFTGKPKIKIRRSTLCGKMRVFADCKTQRTMAWNPESGHQVDDILDVLEIYRRSL